MNAPTVSISVAKRFHELRRRYLVVRIGIALALAVAALMLILMALAVCDYLWEWSITWRKVGLWIALAAVFVGVAQQLYVVVQNTRQRKFAAQVEHSFDGFGQRIRTVLDTVAGRVSGPDEMLSALGHQTLGRWETLTPSRLIPSRALVACGLLCLATILVAAGMFLSGGDMRTAMRRALGQQVPYTQLAVAPGDVKMLEGAAVEVSVDLIGRTDRDVMLRYRHLQETQAVSAAKGDLADQPDPALEWTESELLPLEPKEGEPADHRRARFASALGKATQPIEYQFVTSVGTTRVYRVDVQPLIEAKRIETQVDPPAYTRLESRSFATASVTVLEQSTVSVAIETNHPLSQVQLEVGEKPSKLKPLPIAAGEDRTQWAFELPTTASLHWRFTGQGNDSTPMIPVKGRLRVRKDAAPSVTWRDPQSELRVHTLAELPMRVQISDDYGIDETGIVFQLGGDDEYVLTDWASEDAEDETTNTTRLKLEQVLPLESFELSERDYISYYAYAIDNRASGPHRAESDVRYIDIRPLRQFYAEIEQDPNNGAAGRVLVQLDEIIRRQRFLINRTRRLLRSSSVNLATQLGTIDRMVESQSELAGLTRFLAEFFVSRGNDDVESLSQAEASMLQAADSLAAGSFDLALVQEEDALRALAEARRSLEIALLKNPTLQQQQALRRLARQMRQKLRRERPETEQQIADSLQRIASEQMQIGQTAARIMSKQNMPSGGGAGAAKQDPKAQQQGGSNGQPTPSSETPTADSPSTDSPSTDSPSSETADGDANTTDPNESEGDQQSSAESSENESDAEQSGDGESDSDESEMDRSGSSPQEPTLAEQQDELFTRQVDLLERLQDIEEQLSDRLASSPLMAKRMEQAESDMDDLATQAREGELGSLASGSQDTAEQIREISMQLDALAASEPVSRVSAIRDMTTSLANLESQLSDQLRQSSQGGNASAESDMQSNGNASSRTAGLARQLQRRTETIEDILKAPVEVGDVETSEVNDYLERFVEESEFLEQLESSRDAGQQIESNETDEDGSGSSNQEPGDENENEETGDDSAEALERAVEYAEAAAMLDDLYRQLVTPRLARLRDIEQKANRLAQQLAQAGKSGEEDPESKSGIRMLQQALEEEGLGELAELLSESETPDEELQAELEKRFGDGDGIADVSIDSNLGTHTSRRLFLVAAELQTRIQEMVLLEISADRDAPVPAQYRRAVDRYFRALAGEADTIDTPAVNPPGVQPGATAPVMTTESGSVQ